MGKENVCKNFKERLAGFDFEVTAFDWLLVIIDKNTNEEFYFHNDPFGVKQFLENHDYIYVAYNCKHYDNYILKGILNNYEPKQIKEINDFIIKDGNDGWDYPYEQYVILPPTCDLMLDMPLRQSLKELEGNMLMDIRESTVDFNIDHPWTKQEFDEMLFYCIQDVKAVLRLIDERMAYMESKVALGELCGLTEEESLYKTNAQLAARSLGTVRKEHDDYHDYVFPKEVNKDIIPHEIIKFVEDFQDVSEDELREDNMKLQWKGLIAGVPHVIGLGGIHGAIENYREESNKDRIIVNYDVTSYYPSLLIQYHYLSRNVADPQIYEDYYHERVEAKKQGDKKKANGLKLVLNTTYGASLQKFNDLYDPLMGVSTCLTGQLLLTQLIMTLQSKIASFQLIQSNTDGIMFSLDMNELEIAREIVKAWSKHTRLGMEEDQIKKVVQKDVNNYAIEMMDGKLKFKGAYLSDHPNGSFTHNSMAIVATAVIKNIMEDIPVEETIMACNEPSKFQLIGKTGSTYDSTIHYVDGDEIPVQKVNRVYAVKNDRYGVVKKVKRIDLLLDEDGERRYYINLKGNRTYKKNWSTDSKGDYVIKKDTIQNCPEHAMIDNSCKITSKTIDTIDKEWYINIARKRISDFYGEEKEKKKMAKAKEEVKEEMNPKCALYNKIFQLGDYLSKQAYVTDGYNDQQGYEYVKSAYYRKVLGQGCRAVGLVFKMSIANRIFQPLERTKNMNLTTILGTISLIDPNTGEFEDYTIMGDGSDNLDKGIYKAETMIIKYFVLNNFLLPDTQDEIDPENGDDDKKVAKEETKTETKSTKKIHATKKEKEEAKETVIKDDEANKEYIKSMIEVLDKIRKVKEGYGEKTYINLNKCLNDELHISNIEAVGIMNKLEERLDEMGLE